MTHLPKIGNENILFDSKGILCHTFRAEVRVIRSTI